MKTQAPSTSLIKTRAAHPAADAFPRCRSPSSVPAACLQCFGQAQEPTGALEVPGIRDAVAFPVPKYSWSSPRWQNRGSEIKMPILKSQLLLQKLYPATC